MNDNMKRPLVVVHDTGRGPTVLFDEQEVEVVWADEKVPHDRLFRPSGKETRGQLELLIGDGQIGTPDDARQKALTPRVAALLDGGDDPGPRHLKLVE